MNDQLKNLKKLIELSNIIKDHDDKIIQAGATLVNGNKKVLVLRKFKWFIR